jgi:hypothetical protein
MRDAFEPGSKRPRPTGHADHNGPALNRMEFLVSIKTKIAAVALAALAVTGGLASTTTQAQAGGGGGLGWGIGAGLVGAAVVGSAIAASNGGYYYNGYRRCGWAPQFDVYGNYMGRIRTCNYY